MKENQKRTTKRYTHEYYLEQVKSLYSDRYTFEKTFYKGAGEKVIVTCKKHGDFETYASSFLNSEVFAGCAKCREENRKSITTKTLTPEPEINKAKDSFVKVSRKNNFDKCDYSQTVYTGIEEDVTIMCKAHGAFTVNTARHKRGTAPCPICNKNRRQKGKTRADEEYNRLSKINGYK